MEYYLTFYFQNLVTWAKGMKNCSPIVSFNSRTDAKHTVQEEHWTLEEESLRHMDPGRSQVHSFHVPLTGWRWTVNCISYVHQRSLAKDNCKNFSIVNFLVSFLHNFCVLLGSFVRRSLSGLVTLTPNSRERKNTNNEHYNWLLSSKRSRKRKIEKGTKERAIKWNIVAKFANCFIAAHFA